MVGLNSFDLPIHPSVELWFNGWVDVPVPVPQPVEILSSSVLKLRISRESDHPAAHRRKSGRVPDYYAIRTNNHIEWTQIADNIWDFWAVCPVIPAQRDGTTFPRVRRAIARAVRIRVTVGHHLAARCEKCDMITLIVFRHGSQGA